MIIEVPDDELCQPLNREFEPLDLVLIYNVQVLLCKESNKFRAIGRCLHTKWRRPTDLAAIYITVLAV